MAKATIRQASSNGDSPSEGIVNPASELKFRVDARGRKIGVKKPNALSRYRLMKILGSENAKNDVLMGHAMLAYLVREIDGEPIPEPQTERLLEAMVARLDDDGLVAVGLCVQEEFGLGGTSEDDVKETIKN